MKYLLALGMLSACGAPTESGCPSRASAPQAMSALSARGIPGPADSATVRVGDAELLVVWKNLTSGRALTAACTWRVTPDGLRLMAEDLFDGTYVIALRPDSSAGLLRYADARGAIIRELRVSRD